MLATKLGQQLVILTKYPEQHPPFSSGGFILPLNRLFSVLGYGKIMYHRKVGIYRYTDSEMHFIFGYRLIRR